MPLSIDPPIHCDSRVQGELPGDPLGSLAVSSPAHLLPILMESGFSYTTPYSSRTRYAHRPLAHCWSQTSPSRTIPHRPTRPINPLGKRSCQGSTLLPAIIPVDIPPGRLPLGSLCEARDPGKMLSGATNASLLHLSQHSFQTVDAGRPLQPTRCSKKLTRWCGKNADGLISGRGQDTYTHRNTPDEGSWNVLRIMSARRKEQDFVRAIRQSYTEYRTSGS